MHFFALRAQERTLPGVGDGQSFIKENYTEYFQEAYLQLHRARR